MRTIVELSEPQSGPADCPIRCEHCGKPIEAWASVTVSGMSAGYEWRHAHDKSRGCAVVRNARPYDGYAAERALDAQHKADR